MGRLAIFVDGDYIDHLAQDEFNLRVDFQKSSQEITNTVAGRSNEQVDLLRTYYYNCPPYQSANPNHVERQFYANYRRFTDALRRLPRFEIREGRLAFRGTGQNGNPIYQQKRVDLMLGLDFALLCGTRQIAHAALVGGDSDLIPAMDIARREGISIWLFHGPSAAPSSGQPTYAQDLWYAADERVEMDAAFMNQVRRQLPSPPPN